MILEEQQPNEPSLQEAIPDSSDRSVGKENSTYFIGKVIHPFDAQAEGELSLLVDDYVVVRQVRNTLLFVVAAVVLTFLKFGKNF